MSLTKNGLNAWDTVLNFCFGHRKHGLQRFLLIVLLLSTSIPALFAGAFLISENYKRTIRQDSQIKANSYAELLQGGMTMPMWNIAPQLGKPVLESVSIDPSVIRIDITTAEETPFLRYRDDDWKENQDSIVTKRNVYYNEELLGYIVLEYSLESAKKRAQYESQLLFTIIIVQLLFSVTILGYILRWRVIRPLSQLESAAVGIAGGDLKTTVPRLYNDEFGALAQQLERMRQAIEENVETLEENVAKRTAALQKVNEEQRLTLEQLQEAKGSLVQAEKLAALGALVAGVAHELNTPIGNGLTVATSMQDSSKKMLERMASGMTRSALEEYLTDMDEGSHLVCASLERASELVASFKQVAVDRQSAQRRRFSLLDVLRETRLTLTPVFKHTPYVVNINVGRTIVLDSYPGPLGQVITNLLNNAVIHAFDGRSYGTVDIEAELVNTTVTLVIRDDGKGISEENLQKVFDPFFTTKLGEGGNGLGMHIVHNIVTGVLGGTIEIISKLGEGTTFILTLPLEAPKRPALFDGNSEGDDNNV